MISNAKIIIQARLGSTRLPNKVMLPINGKPMISYVIEACKATTLPVVLATERNSKALLDVCKEHEIGGYVGSEHDVLSRYFDAAIAFEADPIIRVTADCPYLQPDLIHRVLHHFRYHRNRNMTWAKRYWLVGLAAGEGCPPGTKRFPDGYDCEAIDFGALMIAHERATDPADREHVTKWIIDNYPERVHRIENKEDMGDLKYSVDTIDDFKLIESFEKGEEKWKRGF